MLQTITLTACFSLLFPFVASECTRAGLLVAADTYLLAQSSGKPSDLPISTANFTYQQNNKISDIAKGLGGEIVSNNQNRKPARC
jgi:hypothetical protein